MIADARSRERGALLITIIDAIATLFVALLFIYNDAARDARRYSYARYMCCFVIDTARERVNIMSARKDVDDDARAA